MSKPSTRHSLWNLASSLGWPTLWGAALAALFYTLIERGALGPLWRRYFAGHPIEYVETIMFFIGLAALGYKACDVLYQYTALGSFTFPEAPAQGRTVEDAGVLADYIADLPSSQRNSQLGERLTDALESIERKGSAAELDSDLKYLADVNAARQQESYALVRIIVWAIPMLGFLGTVVGITEALAQLSPEALVETPKKAMEGLLGGLAVAFDTTAIALSFSIALMFLQFILDGVETLNAGRVERRAAEELLGRFQTEGGANDPHLATFHRLGDAVTQSTERLVERQSKLWEQSLGELRGKWEAQVGTAGTQLQTALTGAMTAALSQHSEALHQNSLKLAESHVQAGERLKGVWDGLQASIVEHAQRMQAQQAAIVQQGEIMTRVLDATGNVMRLEKSLNENLQALAGSKNFEDTVLSLSAAVSLLATRLNQRPEPPVELKKPKVNRAA